MNKKQVGLVIELGSFVSFLGNVCQTLPAVAAHRSIGFDEPAGSQSIVRGCLGN